MTINLQPGSHFGDYTLERRLGGGGFGDVWLSRSVSSARVALKVLHGQYQTSEAARLRAEIELLAAAASSRSPHIVRVLGGGSDPAPYVVMEYIEGTDLGREIARRGSLSVVEVLRIADGVAGALATLQEFGIIHRDIKPANVMIDSQNVVKLTDFGIAKIVGLDSITTTNHVAMSVAYAAPEAFEGQVSYLSDHYAFGALLYHLLTGRTLFTGTYIQIMRHHVMTPPDLGPLPSDTPVPLRSLISACLAKAPEDRPVNADALLQAVKAAQEELVEDMTATVIQTRVVEPRQLGPWLIQRRIDGEDWLFDCHHESTGAQAFVEVHFSDDLDRHNALRALPNQGVSRFVLRPGEGWANAPSTRFSFWLARLAPEAAPSLETAPLSTESAHDQTTIPQRMTPIAAAPDPPAAAPPVASSPVIEAAELAIIDGAPGAAVIGPNETVIFPKEEAPPASQPMVIPRPTPPDISGVSTLSPIARDDSNARLSVRLLHLYLGACAALLVLVVFESIHRIKSASDLGPPVYKIETFADIALALVPTVLAYVLLQTHSDSGKRSASSKRLELLAPLGLIGTMVFGAVGLVYSVVTFRGGGLYLWTEYGLAVLGLSYCLAILGILTSRIERVSPLRTYAIMGAALLFILGGVVAVKLAHYEDSEDFLSPEFLPFLSGAFAVMLNQHKLPEFVYGWVPYLTVTVLVVSWNYKATKALWFLSGAACLVILFIDVRSVTLLHRLTAVTGNTSSLWPLIWVFLQQFGFGVCIVVAMLVRTVKFSPKALVFVRGSLVVLLLIGLLGCWVGFSQLINAYTSFIVWAFMRYALILVLGLVMVEELALKESPA